MIGDPLSPDYSVARYCKPSTFDNGAPSSGSFSLRPDEEYLSVFCLQLTGEVELLKQQDCVRQALAETGFVLGKNALFATLKVGEILARAKAELMDPTLEIKHAPPPDSHSGIYGFQDDMVVEDLLLDCCSDTFPAVP